MFKNYNFINSLRIQNVRLFIGATGFFTLASRALAVVIGFQIYNITHSVLSLGWLGLFEAIPAIGVAPFGGYVADHYNRKKILLLTRAVSIICTLCLAVFSFKVHKTSILGLYVMIFIAGIARGFADPSSSGFEAEVVPEHLTVNASSWISTIWVGCSVIGPAVIGFIFDWYGASISYIIISISFFLSWILTTKITPEKEFKPSKKEKIFKSIKIGWSFVFKNQPLFSAMLLDMFSVFFGGAIILLPVFANDILHTGAKGLGLLNAAPSFGTMIISLWATKYPPIEKAGRNLLITIIGFGISIIIFAFSKNFLLSITALFFSGVFDGISVVIRRSMLRLLSPNELRGRIASASMIFICASNELGAFESGFLASFIGTIPCVAFGGFLTLGIVALTAFIAKELRQLSFDPKTLERKL
jgi:MFS family permease